MNIPVTLIRSAMDQIFETMYFSHPEYRGLSRICCPAITTSVCFSGVLHGEFRVAVSDSLAHRMTADFLALEPSEVNPDHVDAMVREFANIACGTIMSSRAPVGGYRFSLPEPPRPCPATAEFEHSFCLAEHPEFDPEFGIDIAFD